MKGAPAITLTGRHSVSDTVLFDADLTFPAGKWTCILGPSGVGKSTVLRLVLGLETGGVFAGKIQASDGMGLEDRVAYMAQSDLLMPWLTVAENVALGARLRGQSPDTGRANNLLEQVGLADHATKKPAALSGGMRQRAALARTLMEDRPVVLLDEPFSALDAGTRANMQDLAFDKLRGKTVVLVTHDPAEATRLADKIYVMSPQSAQTWPVPPSPSIRKLDAPDVLAHQADLLAHLHKVTA